MTEQRSLLIRLEYHKTEQRTAIKWSAIETNHHHKTTTIATRTQRMMYEKKSSISTVCVTVTWFLHMFRIHGIHSLAHLNSLYLLISVILWCPRSSLMLWCGDRFFSFETSLSLSLSSISTGFGRSLQRHQLVWR